MQISSSAEPILKDIIHLDFFLWHVLPNYDMKELIKISHSCKLARKHIVSEKDGLFKTNRTPLKNLMEKQNHNENLVKHYMSELVKGNSEGQ